MWGQKSSLLISLPHALPNDLLLNNYISIFSPSSHLGKCLIRIVTIKLLITPPLVEGNALCTLVRRTHSLRPRLSHVGILTIIAAFLTPGSSFDFLQERYFYEDDDEVSNDRSRETPAAVPHMHDHDIYDIR
jgi:hypothetical protein